MRPTIQVGPRQPLSEVSRAIGKQLLHLRLYRERSGFVCERQFIEADGSSATQTLPFQAIHQVNDFLLADPLYSQIKADIHKILDAAASKLCHELAPNS